MRGLEYRALYQIRFACPYNEYSEKSRLFFLGNVEDMCWVVVVAGIDACRYAGGCPKSTGEPMWLRWAFARTLMT